MPTTETLERFIRRVEEGAHETIFYDPAQRAPRKAGQP
jgi:hypothetical protein